LLLRPLLADDLDAYAALMADPAVVRHLGGKPYTRKETARSLALMMRRFSEDGYGQLAVVRRTDQRFLGRCGFLVWEVDAWRPTTRAAARGETATEISWRLGREHWGRGYTTEAATAVRDYAFETLGLRRLIALIIRENHRSIAVARRIGMTLAGKIDVERSTTLLYATSARAG
jgi:RimJ/RimL family protein N-acetyltransferase